MKSPILLPRHSPIVSTTNFHIFSRTCESRVSSFCDTCGKLFSFLVVSTSLNYECEATMRSYSIARHPKMRCLVFFSYPKPSQYLQVCLVKSNSLLMFMKSFISTFTSSKSGSQNKRFLQWRKPLISPFLPYKISSARE